MKKFDHFNPVNPCLICGTTDDKPCTLVPIDGTKHDRNCEAVAIHIDCINLRFNKELGIFYQKI